MDALGRRLVRDAARAVRPRAQRAHAIVAEKIVPWGRIEGEVTVENRISECMADAEGEALNALASWGISWSLRGGRSLGTLSTTLVGSADSLLSVGCVMRLKGVVMSRRSKRRTPSPGPRNRRPVSNMPHLFTRVVSMAIVTRPTITAAGDGSTHMQTAANPISTTYRQGGQNNDGSHR